MIRPHVTSWFEKTKLNIASHFMDTTSDWTQRHEYDYLMNFILLMKSLAIQIGLNSKKYVY